MTWYIDKRPLLLASLCTIEEGWKGRHWRPMAFKIQKNKDSVTMYNTNIECIPALSGLS